MWCLRGHNVRLIVWRKFLDVSTVRLRRCICQCIRVEASAGPFFRTGGRNSHQPSKCRQSARVNTAKACNTCPLKRVIGVNILIRYERMIDRRIARSDRCMWGRCSPWIGLLANRSWQISSIVLLAPLLRTSQWPQGTRSNVRSRCRTGTAGVLNDWQCHRMEAS